MGSHGGIRMVPGSRVGLWSARDAPPWFRHPASPQGWTDILRIGNPAEPVVVNEEPCRVGLDREPFHESDRERVQVTMLGIPLDCPIGESCLHAAAARLDPEDALTFPTENP